MEKIKTMSDTKNVKFLLQKEKIEEKYHAHLMINTDELKQLLRADKGYPDIEINREGRFPIGVCLNFSAGLDTIAGAIKPGIKKGINQWLLWMDIPRAIISPVVGDDYKDKLPAMFGARCKRDGKEFRLNLEVISMDKGAALGSDYTKSLSLEDRETYQVTLM